MCDPAPPRTGTASQPPESISKNSDPTYNVDKEIKPAKYEDHSFRSLLVDKETFQGQTSLQGEVYKLHLSCVGSY